MGRARPQLLTAAGIAWALAILIAMSCRPTEEVADRPPVSQRLFDRLDRAEVIRAEVARASKVGTSNTRASGNERSRTSRLLPLPERRLLSRVALRSAADDEERLAVVLEPGGRIRFPLAIDEPEFLFLSVAQLSQSIPDGESLSEVNGRDSSGRSSKARITLEEASGRVSTIAEVEVEASDGWVDIDTLIEHSLDREGFLIFEVPESAGGSVAWASPELRTRARQREPGMAPQKQGPPNVLLISLDTLRADRLGSYGYSRPTSPFLDDLADRSWRFDEALSHSPWTRPSHRALFTGLYPLSHQSGRPEYLAEVLWRAGYRTEAWTGGGQVDFQLGFGRGFDRYSVSDWMRSPESWESRLRDLPEDRPWLLFLHTYEIHDPYTDPRFAEGLPAGRLHNYFNQDLAGRLGPLSDDEKAYVGALYDGGIAFADGRLRQLFATLEKDARLRNTIVLITSDHGEEFWEHGSWRHGQSVHRHQLRVPLIVHLPDSIIAQSGLEKRGVVEDPVRLIDIAPTLYELTGVSPERLPTEMQGRSLVPLLQGDPLPMAPTLAEDLGTPRRESKSLRLGAHKVIRTEYFDGTTPPSTEHYDLEADPGERFDRSSEQHEEWRRIEIALQALTGANWAPGSRPELPDSTSGATTAPLDERLEERLRALGYLD